MSPFFWGHWYPCFGLPVTSPLGFKARVGSALFELSRGIRVTLHIPWDSSLVWHLLTSWQPAWQPSRLFQAMRGIGGTRNQELSCCCSQCEIRQTFYRLSYPGSALVLELCFFPLADKNTWTYLSRQESNQKLFLINIFYFWTDSFEAFVEVSRR